MEKLYCPECGNYLMAGDGHCHDCPCGWKQDRHMESDVDEIESMRQQLAECERERDEYRVNYKATKIQLENANETLATVTAERDDLMAALKEVLRAYVPWFDSRFLGLRGDPQATLAAAKEFRVYYSKVKGEDAIAKLGADKTGEK